MNRDGLHNPLSRPLREHIADARERSPLTVRETAVIELRPDIHYETAVEPGMKVRQASDVFKQSVVGHNVSALELEKAPCAGAGIGHGIMYRGELGIEQLAMQFLKARPLCIIDRENKKASMQ